VTIQGLNGWTSQCCDFTQQYIYHNHTSEAVNLSGTNPISPGVLALQPGGEGQTVILRWSAPGTGQYLVKAAFSGLDLTGHTDTAVAILHNGNQLYSGNVKGDGSSGIRSYSGAVSIQKGDDVDFTVASVNASNSVHDTTRLSISITPIE
jgi:hypothetical protein